MTEGFDGRVRVLHSEADLPRNHPAHRKFAQLPIEIKNGVVDSFSPNGLVIYSSFTWPDTGAMANFMSSPVSGGSMVAMRLCPCINYRTSSSGFTFVEYTPKQKGQCIGHCVFQEKPLHAVWRHPAFAPRPWEDEFSKVFPELDVLAAMMVLPSLAFSLQKVYQARFMRTNGSREWFALLDRCSGILTR